MSMELITKLKPIASQFVSLRQNDPAIFWRKLLYGAFWLYIALFPISYAWREVLPPLCFIFLLMYWRHGWELSTLRNLKVWPLFIFLALMVIGGVIFSTDPRASLIHAGTGLNKAYILPFIAMECARSEKELKNLVWAFAVACFWEGLDGVWQALHGHDFIMGYPLNAGRLTGSLGDYTVGNYLALTLIPATGAYFLLRERLRTPVALLVFFALFWPAAFLLQGASSRSAILALAGALVLWFFITGYRLTWRMLFWPASLVGLFMICQPGRISVSTTLEDNRWDLWSLAWRVFIEHPFFGAGAGQYNAAFQSLGLKPEREVITISHPHDLYLDLLYAHGLIGFMLGMTFIMGFLYWGWRHIRASFMNKPTLYWKLAALFWLDYAGWLINGIFGHDFYRTWWLAQAMISLGIMAGAITNGDKAENA